MNHSIPDAKPILKEACEEIDLTVQVQETNNQVSQSCVAPTDILGKIVIDSKVDLKTLTPESTEEPIKSLGKISIDYDDNQIDQDSKLSKHPCTIEHVHNYSTKRMNKVITCLYDN